MVVWLHWVVLVRGFTNIDDEKDFEIKHAVHGSELLGAIAHVNSDLFRPLPVLKHVKTASISKHIQVAIGIASKSQLQKQQHDECLKMRKIFMNHQFGGLYHIFRQT